MHSQLNYPSTANTECRAPRSTARPLRSLVSHALVLFAMIGCGCTDSATLSGENVVVPESRPAAAIDSLQQLSLQTLRARKFGSTVKIEASVDSKPYTSYLASYQSDGLRVYTRIDIPLAPVPEIGFPVVLFVHGWMGIDAAPDLDFYYGDDSSYGEMIDRYVAAGFAVFSPGSRGHGNVNGIPADGIEFMRAWDNGSYLSPVFYALDVLNLLDSLDSFDAASLDVSEIHIVGHSQGGDVVLTALAVAGEGSDVRNKITSASIWSGNIASRFTQLVTFSPMQKSPQAFLTGDNDWNGTAVSSAGVDNPQFVFGYPPDWIETPHPEEWTWQKESWSSPTVASAVIIKLDEMYAAINGYVTDIDGADYQLSVTDVGELRITHDARVRDGMRRIDAFDHEQFLTEPLTLHHSDRDFYSFPDWNADLCDRINQAGGQCQDYEYAENTHGLKTSQHAWFSSADAVAGFDTALQRDIAMFRSYGAPSK